MSDFVFLLRSAEADYQQAMGTPERAQKSLETWMAWIADLEAKGQLKNPGIPLERSGKLVSGKELTVSDGPFAEAKDIVLGFVVITAHDLNEAIAIAKTCPIAVGGGAVEVRPVMQGPM
ncbi:MAG TPA: YciI family protein [Polyangiaceae bacterium]|nr:YciI family protein [Polyangiaceae bacterium]